MKISTIHKVFPILLLSPCLQAQVPYEFFEIHEITPAANINTNIPVQRPEQVAPEALYLDTNTGIGGDLSLFEPFAPPVGVYKRVNIFTHPVFSDQKIFYIQDPIIKCEKANIASKYPRSYHHRSASIDLELSEKPTRLPGDSPEMLILSIKTTPLDPTVKDTAKLYHCDPENYYLTSEQRAKYRIEYEIASPDDAAIPKPAEFFIDTTAQDIEIDPQIADTTLDVIRQIPELVKIKSHPQSLSQLILYFQGFETSPLDDGQLPPDTPEMSMDQNRMRQILTKRKGICRHRAFLFTLIAQTWGYKVRIVVNEVHAFVEILAHGRWYPVEFGGKAQSLTVHSNSQTAPVTIQREISFLDQPTSHATASHGGVTVEQESDSEVVNLVPSHWSSSEFKYISMQFPSSIIRDKVTEISGIMADLHDVPLKHKKFRLKISHPLRASFIFGDFETNERGYFSIHVQLPPDWPIGESTIQWQMQDGSISP